MKVEKFIPESSGASIGKADGDLFGVASAVIQNINGIKEYVFGPAKRVKSGNTGPPTVQSATKKNYLGTIDQPKDPANNQWIQVKIMRTPKDFTTG